jgi:hypothetical protein
MSKQLISETFIEMHNEEHSKRDETCPVCDILYTEIQYVFFQNTHRLIEPLLKDAKKRWENLGCCIGNRYSDSTGLALNIADIISKTVPLKLPPNTLEPSDIIKHPMVSEKLKELTNK